jgi:amidase
MRLIIFLTFLINAFASATLPNHASIENFPRLMDADLDDVIGALAAGLFTSVDLVNAYTARINEVNERLHVVTEINPDAVQIAADLDRKRAEGGHLGPLHGLPIILKDNIATADKLNNTAGSYALLGAKVSQDSTVAAKLRNAGAILLGKSNLSQWEFFRSVNTTQGWSAYGGQTLGGYSEDQEPGGSSSGSAVASSLGLVLASIGTETMGSIVLPAGVNNVVGIKPTVGLTSRYLVVPISERQDTVGPLARTVKDAAHILQVIAGSDEHDNYTSAIPNNADIPDYVAACKNRSLAGIRLGVPNNVVEYEAKKYAPALLQAFQAALNVLSDAGATIVEANFTAYSDVRTDQNNTAVLAADFLAALPRYLDELDSNPHRIHNLADLRNWTRKSPHEDFPARDTLVWDLAVGQAWDNTDPRFWPAYENTIYLGGEGGVLGALAHSNTSAILLPTAFAPQVPSYVGTPIVSVPMGAYPNDTEVLGNSWGTLVVEGPNVPFGLSFLGKHWSEASLIGLAYSYEQRTKHRDRVRPLITPRTELREVVGRSMQQSFSIGYWLTFI